MRVYGGSGFVDVVLFGPVAAHLHSNFSSSLKPPLPDADRTKLAAFFGHLTGIGLDGPQRSFERGTWGGLATLALCRCLSARMVMRSSR